MSTEREILLTVLRLTKDGPAEALLIGKAARIPTETAESLLEELADNVLVKRKGKIVEASPEQRVKIAVEALKLGADFEYVCRTLEWREFESITNATFEAFEYRVVKNFRFKERSGKRWEIDLLAFKRPLIVSVDCKHWQHNWTRVPITKAVEEHVDRTRAFTEALPKFHTKIELVDWTKATVIPMVLSLLPSPFKFHNNTPIVPVLELQSFINEFPAHVDALTCFRQELMKIDRKITEY